MQIFPQLLFYLLDIVIHLVLQAGGGGCGRIVGRRPEPACTLTTPGSWGGAGGNGRARASAEFGGVELRPSRPLASQRSVCMQGRAGPSGREAPSPGP